MRIVQIIDSLEAGGAERMAVNYANGLADRIEFSGLVVTRKEGALFDQIDTRVSYFYLVRKKIFDFKALVKLRKYIIENKVTHMQAHSTSFFLAFLLKIGCPSIVLIWHDHYGDSEFLNKRSALVLQFIMPFFRGIITVNKKLKDWSESKLHFKNTIYLPNFPAEGYECSDETLLQGIPEKQIVCMANLREQKDHFLLLAVAKKIQTIYPDWTFHLVGKDFYDDYSINIKSKILELGLEKNVFLYGTKQDVKNILDQASIAILTSKSEGLPMALLEYGQQKKPVVVTDVGEISSLIIHGVNGFLVPSLQEQLFTDALIKLIENESLRKKFGQELFHTINDNFTSEIILKQYLNWLQYNCK